MSYSAQHRKKQSPACMKGKVISEECCKKLSEAAKNREKTKICDYCQQRMTAQTYGTFHGEKCRIRIEKQNTQIKLACPRCGTDVVYKSWTGFNKAKIRKTVCKTCRIEEKKV